MPTCPSCGVEVPQSFDSCDNCGNSLAADDAAEADRRSVRRLPALDILRWSAEGLARSPALLSLALFAGVAGVVVGRFVSPEVEWLLTTAAALYPSAVAHRYVAAWVADEDTGTAAFLAAVKRLPSLFGVYLGVVVVLFVTLFLAVLVFRPAFGLLVWLCVFLYLMLRFALAFPAAVLAERNPLTALEESWTVSPGARGTVAGIALLLVVASLPSQVVEGGGRLQVAAGGASGLLSTLCSAAFARVYLQQTL